MFRCLFFFHHISQHAFQLYPTFWSFFDHQQVHTFNVLLFSWTLEMFSILLWFLIPLCVFLSSLCGWIFCCTLFLFVLLVFCLFSSLILVTEFLYLFFVFLFVLWWQCCVSRGSHRMSGWICCFLLFSVQPEGRGPSTGLIWMYGKFWVRWHLMSSRDHFLSLVFPLLDVCYFGSLIHFIFYVSFTSSWFM